MRARSTLGAKKYSFKQGYTRFTSNQKYLRHFTVFVTFLLCMSLKGRSQDFQEWADEGPAHWVNSTLNATRSNYFEGEVVPFVYRTASQVMGDYSFVITYDYYNKSANAGGFSAIKPYNTSRTPDNFDGGSSPGIDDNFLDFYTVNADITNVVTQIVTASNGSKKALTTVSYHVNAGGVSVIYWGLFIAQPKSVGIGTNGAADYPGGSLSTNININGTGNLGFSGGQGNAIIEGTISGQKYKDIDGNGIKDGNDVGISGWTIFIDANQNDLLDLNETSTVTDAQGNYSFSVIPGTYRIREVLLAGWAQITPSTGYYDIDITTLAPQVTDVLFGNKQNCDAAQPTVTTVGSLNFCSGGSATLSTTANANYHYQWYKDGQPIATATSSSYVASTSGQYSVTVEFFEGCFNTSDPTTIEVLANANAGTVSGTSPICIGATGITYTSNGDERGTWSSSDETVATIDASTGAITAKKDGQTTITYTVTGCGSDLTATQILTVSANANPGTITGTSAICVNATGIVYTSNGDANGTWSSSDETVATIDPNTGAITPKKSGSTVITYAVTGCGNNLSTTQTLTVDPLPTASAGGSQTICVNGTATVSGASSSNGTILWTEDGAGSITSGADGLTPIYTPAAADAGKTVTLTMTVTSNNSCGTATATATYSVTVTPLPQVTSPSAVIITYPDNASFSSNISGTTTNAVYWKEKIGSTYSTISNSAPYTITTLPNNTSTLPTASTLAITSPPVSWSGRKYQVNVDGCSITASSEALLTVNPRQLCLTYDGLTFGTTNTSRCYVDNNGFGVGVIRLILTVVGNPPGDLSSAEVKVNVSGGGVSNQTAHYVAASGTNAAYYYYDWTVPCPAFNTTATSEIFEVTWTVGGNYTNVGCNETETLITISGPSPDFTTGGGYILNSKSKGTLGIAQNETPSKNNYGFNLKWGNNMKTLQGNFNTIIRTGGRQYQVKTNKPTFLATKARPDLAYTVNGKTVTPYEACMTYENAVFKDLTGLATNNCASSLIPGCSQGNSGNTVYLRVIDMGEPNSGATIGTINRIDSFSMLIKWANGTVLYSSESYTVVNNPAVIKLLPIVKGNIQVHVGNNAPVTMRDIQTQTTLAQVVQFSATPNPSHSYFTIQLPNATNSAVNLKVVDVLGRVVEAKQNLAAGQSLRIGSGYTPGIYIIQVQQGDTVKQLKLVKQ